MTLHYTFTLKSFFHTILYNIWYFLYTDFTFCILQKYIIHNRHYAHMYMKIFYYINMIFNYDMTIFFIKIHFFFFFHQEKKVLIFLPDANFFSPIIFFIFTKFWTTTIWISYVKEKNNKINPLVAVLEITVIRVLTNLKRKNNSYIHVNVNKTLFDCVYKINILSQLIKQTILSFRKNF